MSRRDRLHHWKFLTTQHRPMNICHQSAQTSVHWPRSPTRQLLHTVINGAVRPLVQINIPEGFLNPVEDRWPKTTEEERREKVWKMVLPTSNAPCLAHELKNGPTHILAAVVWLKLNCKYFNEGTAKEACDRFEVRAKVAVQSADREEVPWWYSGKETQGHRRTTGLKKEGRHLNPTLKQTNL